MATNIEIKARIHDFEDTKIRVESLSDTPVTLIPQEDTFFHIPFGRLKLREFSDNEGQLIYYLRDDIQGPKQSNYLIYSTSESHPLKVVLSSALGIRGVVHKHRLLYSVGKTRIHLDQVEGLGSFLELEVVLGEGESPEQGEAIAKELISKLGIKAEDLIEGAYIDLLDR